MISQKAVANIVIIGDFYFLFIKGPQFMYLLT